MVGADDLRWTGNFRQSFLHTPAHNLDAAAFARFFGARVAAHIHQDQRGAVAIFRIMQAAALMIEPGHA